MFDGVPVEHYHRFIISSTIPPPNSSPLIIQTPPAISTSTSTTDLNFLSNFDPPILFPPPPLHHHHHQQTLFQSNHFVPRHDTTDQDDANDQPWSNDEVIQLLRIKSTSDNWFTNWDHVSRKLAEIGYKRSSAQCKDKFEEETCCRSFSSSIECNKSSNRYLISTQHQLDDQCNTSDQNTHHHVTIESVHRQEQPHELHEEETGVENLEAQGQKGHFEKDPIEVMEQSTQDDDAQLVEVAKSKKRKRKHKKFKMVKGLCVDMVNKMMAQQEEMHKKLLEDMVNRDEEKTKREEAWRKEELERMEMEIQIREHEQEMARDRQSTITEFLNKITSLDTKIQIPSNINLQDLQAITKPMSLSEVTKIPSLEMNINQDDRPIAKDEIGKRWPRDEVLALINIRSNSNSNGIGGNYNEVEQGKGCSLWERVSQGMLELGYKRSAKRCKEKWENINKYFRKTKDGNKKRSLESRTCPYYHELTKLYNQEKQQLA